MSKATMLEILQKQYGISNEEELDKAMSDFPGVDIGIFTSEIERRGVIDESIPA